MGSFVSPRHFMSHEHHEGHGRPLAPIKVSETQRISSGLLGGNIAMLMTWSQFWSGNYKDAESWGTQNFAKRVLFRPTTVIATAPVGWVGGVVVGSLVWSAFSFGESMTTKSH
eukprot:gb/GEZN01015518.1/.p1 GENE.gb/GEZN01015518.1/~~gb/GEZN01015518.1/.p1  ORF type:complete len:113 (+),score=1.72 gb/GEZN01015518.1/:183-521(+)